MLAFLAAVVPIIGALYVGTSFLVEQQRLAHEKRVRLRIRRLVDERHRSNIERARLLSSLAAVDMDALMRERAAFERMLLEANGVTARGKTWGDWDLEQAMSRPVLPAVERRRQWVLLLSSALGLALLAIDALPRTE